MFEELFYSLASGFQFHSNVPEVCNENVLFCLATTMNVRHIMMYPLSAKPAFMYSYYSIRLCTYTVFCDTLRYPDICSLVHNLD